MADFDFDTEEEVVIVTPLDEMFKAYCRMDPLSYEKQIELLPLSQIDKWFKLANVLDMKNVTTTDTGLGFFKFRKRAINYDEFLQFLEDLVKTKKLNWDIIKEKLETSKKPIHPNDVVVISKKK